MAVLPAGSRALAAQPAPAGDGAGPEMQDCCVPSKGHPAHPSHKVSRARVVPKEMGILPRMDPHKFQELFQVLAANVGK